MASFSHITRLNVGYVAVRKCGKLSINNFGSLQRHNIDKKFDENPFSDSVALENEQD
jgi:hypothetical protein